MWRLGDLFKKRGIAPRVLCPFEIHWLEQAHFLEALRKELRWKEKGRPVLVMPYADLDLALHRTTIVVPIGEHQIATNDFLLRKADVAGLTKNSYVNFGLVQPVLKTWLGGKMAAIQAGTDMADGIVLHFLRTLGLIENEKETA